MSVTVKLSSFGPTWGLGVSSRVGPEFEGGASEDSAMLDWRRLHWSPRFTHLKQGISSSHFCESASAAHVELANAVPSLSLTYSGHNHFWIWYELAEI